VLLRGPRGRRKLVLVWALERSGDTVWAGKLPCGLCASADVGDRWQAVWLNLPPAAAVRLG